MYKIARLTYVVAHNVRSAAKTLVRGRTMTESELAFWGSWASIISLVIAVVTLLYVRTIKANIIKFRRRQRIRQLLDDIFRIPDDAVPLASASRTKLNSLKRNLPKYFWSGITNRGKTVIEIHKHVDASDIAALKEAINDWSSYSEEV
jgi:hypothetical protein